MARVLAVGACSIVLLAVSPRTASAVTAPNGGSTVEGSQGTDASLPPTSSAKTISASDVLGANSPFAGLSITVNQTSQLSNQAVSITWTGGTPTNSDRLPTGQFADNYLQIFQCWGPDDGENAADPGPAPTGCEFGANELNGSVLSLSPSGSSAISRQIQTGDSSRYSYIDPAGSGTYIPFDPVDGSSPIDIPTAQSSDPSNPGAVWANSLFDYTTSNEVDYARTYSDGTGQQLFTIDTGLEAPGLGCGQSVQQPNGKSITPQCWLVVVPRGDYSYENPPGTGGGSNPSVETSPLSGAAWAHRIAFPLSFNPVGAACNLGATQDRIVGSELASPAATNWEPALCSSASSPPYQYSALSDDQARQEILQAGGFGAPGMAVTSQGVDPSLLPSNAPMVYAPLTLSGVVIGFNIDRQTNVNANDPAESALAGRSVVNVYLTPRLVAKLLTESYTEYFRGLNPFSPPTGYSWIKSNPFSLVSDKDFLQFNPEFSLLACQGSPDCAGLIVEQPNADASIAVWNWILHDPEAKAWLDGTPDQWGMKVNPVYSTLAKNNSTGAAFAAAGAPSSYPKSDPYTYQDPTQLVNANNQLPRPLGVSDFLPYAGSLQSAALETRTANDGAKLTANYGALSPELVWTSNGPQPIGEAFTMSITDSADARQYGLQVASLSRAGDDSAERTFVTPDVASIEAGQQAMLPSSVSAVLTPNPTTSFPGAYPLAMLTYAEVPAAKLTTQACKDYAAFIKYATTTGQVQGTSLGNLPLGYAPLAPSLVAQATAAEATIVSECGKANTQTDDTTTTTAPSSSTTTASGGGGGGGGGGGSSSSTTPTASSTTSPTTTGKTTGGSGTTTPTTAATSHVGLSASRTSAVSVTATRYVVPIILGLGLIAGLGGRWMSVWARRVPRK
jgi:hypothetical protein